MFICVFFFLLYLIVQIRKREKWGSNNESRIRCELRKERKKVRAHTKHIGIHNNTIETRELTTNFQEQIKDRDLSSTQSMSE